MDIIQLTKPHNGIRSSLEFDSGATALHLAHFGLGTGSIFLDNVHCTGCEGRLIDCRANTITVHNCVHFEDAGVRCMELGTSKLVSIRQVIIISSQ